MPQIFTIFLLKCMSSCYWQCSNGADKCLCRGKARLEESIQPKCPCQPPPKPTPETQRKSLISSGPRKAKTIGRKNTYIPLHVAKVLASLDSNGLNVTKPCQSYEVSPIKPPKSLGVKHWRASLQVIVAKAPAASQHPSPGSHDDVSQDFVSLPCGCVKSTWKSLLDFCCILFASGTLGKMLAEQVVAACQERPSI